MRAGALLVLALLLAPSLAHAGGGFHVKGDVAGHKIRIHVDTPDDNGPILKPVKKLLRGLLGVAPAQPELVMLIEWTQPAVRGSEDFIAGLGLVPREGTWNGVYWVETGEGVQRPRSVTIDHEGGLFILKTHLTAAPDEITVRYHFLGEDGRELVYDLPPLPVLDQTPQADTIAIGGAAAGQSWPGLPELLIVSTWNLHGDPRVAGFTIRDQHGDILQDWTAGGCTDETFDAPESEPGCRVLFVIANEGTTLTTWSHDTNGQRVGHETLDLTRLREGPYRYQP